MGEPTPGGRHRNGRDPSARLRAVCARSPVSAPPAARGRLEAGRAHGTWNMTVGPAEAGSYDEFSMLRIYAEHEGIRWDGPPAVRRQSVVVDGRTVSSLVWG